MGKETEGRYNSRRDGGEETEGTNLWERREGNMQERRERRERRRRGRRRVKIREDVDTGEEAQGRVIGGETYKMCRSEFAYILNRPPLLCVNVYEYTVYVKQRAEKQHVKNLPRHSRTEGHLVRWPASLQNVFTLFSLLSGKNGRKSHSLVRSMFYMIDCVHLSCICA
jgi:hypothetical protein